MFGNKKQSNEIELLTKELDRTKEVTTQQLYKLRTEKEDEIARIKANADVVLLEKTANLNKEIKELSIKTEIQKSKIEMYEKAFENLGFDVKDMKEILNKLVDGIVSKNTIQLVK